MNTRIALRNPIATLSRRWACASTTRSPQREWGSYFGSFGDDFFGDDD